MSKATYSVKKVGTVYHIKINEQWFPEETFDLLDELEGIMRLDEHYSQLIENGDVTRETLSQIEKFRHKRIEGNVRYKLVKGK